METHRLSEIEETMIEQGARERDAAVQKANEGFLQLVGLLRKAYHIPPSTNLTFERDELGLVMQVGEE